MGANSNIEWTTHTFNPWIGCAKVSPACKHCYAEVATFTRAQRAKGLELWGEKAARHAVAETNWKEMRKLHAKAAAAGVRERVFCGSMMDVYERPGFDDTGGLLAQLRVRLWVLIEETPSFDWLLLTKRPENAQACVPSAWWTNGFPPNVWQGFTAEDSEHFEERWRHAREIPADVRFVSYEPALGPLDLPDDVATHLHWGIVGSESGHGARDMQIEWVERFVDRCWNLDVSPFVKQIANGRDRKGGDPAFWPKSPWGNGEWPREFPVST
jgi:protein gp37